MQNRKSHWRNSNKHYMCYTGTSINITSGATLSFLYLEQLLRTFEVLVECSIDFFRTHNSKTLEEENLRLFIRKSKEMLGIKNIFGEEKEKVFRSATNFSIVLNAIAQISQKSERSQGRLKTKVTFECFEVNFPFISRRQAWELPNIGAPKKTQTIMMTKTQR